jgi:hypothetical protein
VNGAEEDGVDNRVQAPARVPGEGSEGTTSAEDSTGASSAAAANTSAGTSLPGENGSAANGSANHGSAAGQPAAQRGQPAFIPAPAPVSTGSGSANSPMAVVSGAANGARGLAAKVGAGFSGLKAKPKPKPRSGAARKPGKPGQGLPPRGQQPGRPQDAGLPSRSAMLSLQRLEPWSVFKFSSLVALVCWVVIFVAVAIIYFALSKLGVFAKIEDTVGLVTANKAHPGADASSWFSASRTMEYTALVCTVNAVLFTVLATLGAVLYNLVASLTGGVEVTLKESD